MATANQNRAKAESAQPAAPAQPAEPARTYRVISPLQHDLVDYAVGSTIDLTDAQAAPLMPHTVTFATERQAPATAWGRHAAAT